MPVSPDGSLITFTQSSPSVSVLAAISGFVKKVDKFSFVRSEWDHGVQREAMTESGAKPVYQTTIGNRVSQYLSGCIADEVFRPLTPNDDDLDNIFKRFDIQRFEIEGARTPATEVDKLFTIAKDHKALTAAFEAHLRIAASGTISIQMLEDMQTETFSYLTTTTLSMHGFSLVYSNPHLTPQTNLIIVDFAEEVVRESPNDYPQTSSDVWKTFKIVLENRALVADRSLTF